MKRLFICLIIIYPGITLGGMFQDEVDRPGAFAYTQPVVPTATVFANDSFADVDSTALASHVPTTVGTAWAKNSAASYALGAPIITSNRVRTSDANTAGFYLTDVPPSADYYVEAVIYQAGSSITGLGPAGRMTSNADTMYWSRYQSSSGEWQLYSSVAGSATKLGSYSAATSDTVSYTIRLSMVGSAIKLYVDGVERISVTNTDIATTGYAGIRGVSQTGGHHIDSIIASTF